MQSLEERWLLEEKYQGEKTPEFFIDSKRLQDGEPLAYILNSVPFLKTNILLTSRPLIPRPETEYWVEKFIATLETNSPTTFLDLCAGSGCIGVAIGVEFNKALVDFVEIDPAHNSTIRENWIRNCSTDERFKIYNGDLFTAIPTPNRYDYILANPPYVDKSLDRVSMGVKAYEPELALYGGAGGLEIISKIVTEAKSFLKPKGELWLEHEPEQAPSLFTLGSKAGFVVHTHIDQYGITRFSQLVLQ